MWSKVIILNNYFTSVINKNYFILVYFSWHKSCYFYMFIIWVLLKSMLGFVVFLQINNSFVVAQIPSFKPSILPLLAPNQGPFCNFLSKTSPTICFCLISRISPLDINLAPYFQECVCFGMIWQFRDDVECGTMYVLG